MFSSVDNQQQLVPHPQTEDASSQGHLFNFVTAVTSALKILIQQATFFLERAEDKTLPGFQAATMKPSALATSLRIKFPLLPSSLPPPKTGFRNFGPWPFVALLFPFFPSWEPQHQNEVSNLQIGLIMMHEASLLQTNCGASIGFASTDSHQNSLIVDTHLIYRDKSTYCSKGGPLASLCLNLYQIISRCNGVPAQLSGAVCQEAGLNQVLGQQQWKPGETR